MENIMEVIRKNEVHSADDGETGATPERRDVERKVLTPDQLIR
jgi:hypothetical protein